MSTKERIRVRELERAEGVYESLWIAAVKTLRAVEWHGNANISTSPHAVCPFCRQYPHAGHAPDCLIGLALKGSDMNEPNANSGRAAI
jgi:hypothetical protein